MTGRAGKEADEGLTKCTVTGKSIRDSANMEDHYAQIMLFQSDSTFIDASMICLHTLLRPEIMGEQKFAELERYGNG